MKNMDISKIELIPKGWGFEKIICNNDKYCGKLLYIAKGKRCSLHYHKVKDEVFYIQSGKVKVYYNDDAPGVIKWANNVKKENPGITNDQYFTAMVSKVLREKVDYWLYTTTLSKGDNFHVPPGRVHQMVALEDTELFEFSTTHRDDDSYRIVKGD